jgi:hypothetical protein
MAKLEVELGADVAELQSKLADAIKGLKGLQAQAKDLDAQFKKGKISADDYYNAIAKNSTDINKASSNVNGLKKSILGSENALNGMTKSTANAVPAVTEFSRIIQDAPYGMQGVANNLQQLTANFGYLKTSAGGVVPALKLMVSSLAGPAGILLAVSVVTSAIVYFGNSSQKAAKDAEELAKKKQSLADTTKTYLESLEAVNQANLVGERSAAKELVNLDLLRSQVNNTNLSLKDRKDAVEELRKLYPSYLKNMTDEKILNGGLAAVYDTLTGSIKERARATASMNAIIKNTETILTLESQLAAKQNEIANQKVENERKIQRELNRTGNQINRIAFASAERQKGENVVTELTKDLVALQGEIQNLQLTNIDLEGNIKVNPTIDPFKTPKTKEAINKSVKEIGLQMGQSFASLNLQPFDFLEEKILKFKDSATGIMRTIDFRGVPLLASTITQFDKDQLTLQTKLLEMNQQFTNLIQNGLANTFNGIGDALGNALANGANIMNELGSALVGGLGSILSEMGTQLIRMGTAAVLAGTVLKLFGTEMGIGAGLAAIAGGIVLKGIGGAMNANRQNQQNTSETNAGTSTSSRGGGFSSGFSGSSGNQTVVFEIAGTKLVGVLSNTLRENRSLGGNLSLV